MRSYETLLSVWKNTISYSNIFDYPMQTMEVYRYAVTENKIDRESFEEWAQKNRQILEEHFSNSDTYWMLKGRNRLADIRMVREKVSNQKLTTAKRFMTLFYLIPWIKLVAVTGTVAAMNADEEADTDIFVITSRRRIWLTRAIMLSILSLFGKRSNEKKRNQNGFCINHMLTEREIALLDQNMYLANDISRMKVLWSKGNTYNDFIQQNEWIKKYQANWWEEIQREKMRKKKENNTKFFNFSMLYFVLTSPLRTPFVFLSWILDLLEKAVKNYQLKNLKDKYPLIHEHDTPLQFHPHDHRDWVLREYYLAVREL